MTALIFSTTLLLMAVTVFYEVRTAKAKSRQ